MKTRTSKSRLTPGHAARVAALKVLCLLCMCGFYAVTASAQTGMPGRILSSSGVDSGGILAFNPDASNVVNLSSNTFDSNCSSEPGHKSVHPSATRDGSLIAFSSSRDKTGAVGTQGSDFRIFVMNSDGTGVRQLTTSAGATIPDGTTAGDINPVISPDGTRVAFTSRRNAPSASTLGLSSIFIINTDGSGLRQVTLPQADGAVTEGRVLSVVWSPDGTRLAFKGVRLAADNQNDSPNFHHVVGFINADGTGETILAVIDSTGIHPGIDWSPDGRFVAIPHGREAQSAPAFRVILFDLQTNTSKEILQEGSIPGGTLNGESGGLRFSPDSQRLVATTTNTSPAKLLVADLNGVQQSLANSPAINNPPLWWQAGAGVPAPDRLELIPGSVVARPGGPPVQMLPTLFDAAGNVISRAAANWTSGCSSGTIRISHQGLVTPGTFTETRTDLQVCAANGGKQACVTIFYNPTTNKSDEPEFFTSHQYFDFLIRTPDAAGLAFWTGGITSCGADAQCVRVKRIDTSAAFFLSIEFQETGFLIYRLYQAAFGDIPSKPVPVRRAEFVDDTRRIGEGVRVGIGDWEERLAANKAAFVNQFVTHPRFITAYPAGMPAAQFVDTLNTNAGGALSPSERDALVADLSSGAKTRAQVLRAVAEDETLKQAEFNEAFVLMQYFGYLGRNPDDAPDTDFGGFNFWLTKLEENGGDFRRAQMVQSFIESIEYRGRFGQ